MGAAPSVSGAARDGALQEAFLEMLAAERGASANTLSAYRRDLEDFREKAGRLADATATDVRHRQDFWQAPPRLRPLRRPGRIVGA